MRVGEADARRIEHEAAAPARTNARLTYRSSMMVGMRAKAPRASAMVATKEMERRRDMVDSDPSLGIWKKTVPVKRPRMKTWREREVIKREEGGMV